MINSTNSIYIDGNVFEYDELAKTFKVDGNDTFPQWLTRPTAFITAIVIGLGVLATGTILLIISLAIAPLLASGIWAAKRKLEKDLYNANNRDTADSEVTEA